MLSSRYDVLLTLFPLQDALPLQLNIKLRVNRRDPSLPDSHGQIWVQLVSAASQDPDLFKAKNSAVEQQMLDFLQLSSEIRFPVRRLVTLWKTERWKTMISRWCETSLGKATFQISTWDWMATYRIDDVSEAPAVSLTAHRSLTLMDLVLVPCLPERAIYHLSAPRICSELC